MYCVRGAYGQLCVAPPGQVLLKYMLKPLIMYPCLSVEVSEHFEVGTVLSLQSIENQAERPIPADVYAKILLVLKTLHKHLFGTFKYLIFFYKNRRQYFIGVLMDSLYFLCIDTAVGEKKVSAILGDQIWEEMSDCIIRECLLYSIPSNSSQLATYDVVTAVSKRHDSVIARGFS